MTDKEKKSKCPCPDTRKLSKEDGLNTLIESQCMQYEALSRQFENHFRNRKRK